MTASKKDSRPLTVETGGKLYLFTAHTVEEYENTKGYISSAGIPGKPLSKADCLRLARTLLNHATAQSVRD